LAYRSLDAAVEVEAYAGLILRTLDSPTTFLAEKRSDKGFLLLPHQRPLRWFHEALVFEAPFRSPPP
jgi:hypothetical protein